MPISFDLEQLRQKYNCVNYFETGLWDPRGEVSSKMALRSGFEKIYCIEIRPDWVCLGLDIFEDDVKTGRYNLILDDSSNMKNYINDKVFENRTMFFLDAHVDNQNIYNYKKRCPLFDELEAIKSIDRKDNIIMIDDLRIIKSPLPWGENSYGNINFLQEIMNKITEINKDYKFSTLNGHIENDVLLAYL
jgi:hypothetical protein